MTSFRRADAVRGYTSTLSNYVVAVNLGLLAHDHCSVSLSSTALDAFSLVPSVDALARRYSRCTDAIPLALTAHAAATRWLYHDVLMSLAEPLPPDEADGTDDDPMSVLLRVCVYTAALAVARAGDVMLPPKPHGVELGLPVVFADDSRSLEDALQHRLLCQEVVAAQLRSLDLPEKQAALVRSLLGNE